MRNWIRRVLALVLALGMTLGLAWADTEIEDSGAEVLELPEAKSGRFADITVENDPMVGPKSGYYKFKSGAKSPYAYVNPSISVNIGTGRIYKTNYTYARIRIANPAQLRTTQAADVLSKQTTVVGTTLAKRAKAVVAINGVLEADVTGESDWAFMDGPVLFQRQWWRPSEKTTEAKLEKWKTEEGTDTLVIDDEGNLVILEAAPWGEIYQQILDMGEHAVNAFSFGPALIVDGEPRYGYSNRQMSTNRVAQRMALCQTGPLEYMVITSEGPENSGSEGLKLDQFIELIASFGDVKTAYNLDGGSSATLIFRKGSENWSKINAGGKKIRPLRDMIYFADGWIPSSKKGDALTIAAELPGEANP